MQGKSGAENQERGSSSDESENDELSISFSNSSSKSSDITWDETGETDHDSQESDPFGDLYCQYNETISPYDRIPLTEKVRHDQIVIYF